MIACALSLALTVCLVVPVSGFAQEKLNPMRNVGAYSAIDGVVIVDNSPENPCHLRFVGGDVRHTKADQEQLWVPVGNYMYQMLLTTADRIVPDAAKQPEDRALLAAHAAWECKSHNEMLHLNQTANPLYRELNGRTWCYWTYDLRPVADRMSKEDKEKAGGPGPQTQHLLTTVLGHKIVILVSTTLIGQKEEEAQAGLLATARTFVVLPKPLTQPQIQELCSHKQP
jgi:hypothetical protein